MGWPTATARSRPGPLPSVGPSVRSLAAVRRAAAGAAGPAQVVQPISIRLIVMTAGVDWLTASEIG